MRPTHSEHIFILFDHTKLAIGKGKLMHMHIGASKHLLINNILARYYICRCRRLSKTIARDGKDLFVFRKKKPSFRIISDFLELLDTKHQSIEIRNGSSNDFGPRLILPSYDVISKWNTLIRTFP